MPSGPPPASAAGVCAARSAASNHAASTVRRAVATVAEQDGPMRTFRYHGRGRCRQTLRCKVRLYDAEQALCKAPRRAAADGGATGARESATLQVKKVSCGAVIGLGRRTRIEQHLLEYREIAEKALAPAAGDPNERLRPGVLRGFRDIDQLRRLEDFQVAAQVAVRQPAKLPECGE